MPAIIASFGYSQLMSNLLSVPVYSVALIITIGVAWLSDRQPDNRWSYIIWPAAIGSLSFITQAIAMHTNTGWLKYLSLMGNTATSWSMVAVILAVLTTKLQTGTDTSAKSGNNTSAATGTAFVVAFGNLGGFVSPQILAASISQTGSYAVAMWVLAIFMAIAAVLTVVLQRRLAAQTALSQLSSIATESAPAATTDADTANGHPTNGHSVVAVNGDGSDQSS